MCLKFKDEETIIFLIAIFLITIIFSLKSKKDLWFPGHLLKYINKKMKSLNVEIIKKQYVDLIFLLRIFRKKAIFLEKIRKLFFLRMIAICTFTSSHVSIIINIIMHVFSSKFIIEFSCDGKHSENFGI